MLYISLQAASNGLPLDFLVWPILIAIFYFFFIRPQTQKQKQQNTFLTTLEKGQEVVTSSGIIGKISKLSDKEVTIQTTEKNFVRVTLGSINKEMTEAFSKVDKK